MFIKFHKMREDRDEKGFTLIELLVVILIIAILAAIAIPVFLNQRRKGWTSQVESALKNMATAQESCLTDPTCNAGQYAGAGQLALLEAQGFKYSAVDITPSIISGSGTAYCMTAVSTRDSTIQRWYSSAEGRPTATACT